MPAGIKFACPHCGRSCKVPIELAGKQGRCPGCRRGLEVPRISMDPDMDSDEAPFESGGFVLDEDDADEETADYTSTARIDPTKKACPSCHLTIDRAAIECPFCHADLAPRNQGPVPWTVIVALIIFFPAPLPGLILAQIGLKQARARRSHETLAWVAVGLNVVFLIIGTMITLQKMLEQG